MFALVHQILDRPQGPSAPVLRRLRTARASAVAACVALMALVALVAGCGRESPAHAARTMAPEARAAGLWDVEFRIERAPSPLGRNREAVARGTLALVATERDLDHDWLQHPTTHAGVFDVDFRPLGFVPEGSGPVPTLVAAVVEPDSLLAATPSAPDGGALALSGAFSADGDSVTGTWSYATRAVGGWGGTFSLHRPSRERR